MSCRVQELLWTMKFLQDCWITLLELFNAATFTTPGGSPFQQALQHQEPLPGNPIQHRPIFTPPSAPENPDSAITCDYTRLGPGWTSCTETTNRTCWLKGPKSQIYDIHTDYEKSAPLGVLRKVYQPCFATIRLCKIDKELIRFFWA